MKSWKVFAAVVVLLLAAPVLSVRADEETGLITEIQFEEELNVPSEEAVEPAPAEEVIPEVVPETEPAPAEEVSDVEPAPAPVEEVQPAPAAPVQEVAPVEPTYVPEPATPAPVAPAAVEVVLELVPETEVLEEVALEPVVETATVVAEPTPEPGKKTKNTRKQEKEPQDIVAQAAHEAEVPAVAPLPPIQEDAKVLNLDWIIWLLALAALACAVMLLLAGRKYSICARIYNEDGNIEEVELARKLTIRGACNYVSNRNSDSDIAIWIVNLEKIDEPDEGIIYIEDSYTGKGHITPSASDHESDVIAEMMFEAEVAMA